ncbi:MurR/RpiR family transcriptional regulator [Aureimonas psammosilenae]|uniref:MurR/RpiR family transcriptional regulator n=1 Tax=Aureimonas psammosilenae TaxID=2495496 RepID=UPI001260865A|nr:MurR/RpiR family transcriptional regulator [Aureimonas psammosilenae]
MDIFSTLQDERPRLSPSEGRIADILLADLEFAVNASIIELASRAAVSPPTVTRFCHRLGCDGFSDFKVKLARASHVGMRYLKPEPESTAGADVAKDVVGKAQNALFLLHRALDPDMLERATDAIAAAEMVHAFGSGGNSSLIAAEAQNRLFRLGLRVSPCSDHAMQLMLASAARSGDLVLASSFSGRNAELARVLQVARGNKVATLALAPPGSPVAEAAEMAVGVDLPEDPNIFRPTSTRFAYLALLDILASLVAYRLRPQASQTLRRIKQQLVTHRDGDDRQMLGD